MERTSDKVKIRLNKYASTSSIQTTNHFLGVPCCLTWESRASITWCRGLGEQGKASREAEMAVRWPNIVKSLQNSVHFLEIWGNFSTRLKRKKLKIGRTSRINKETSILLQKDKDFSIQLSKNHKTSNFYLHTGLIPKFWIYNECHFHSMLILYALGNLQRASI